MEAPASAAWPVVLALCVLLAGCLDGGNGDGAGGGIPSSTGPTSSDGDLTTPAGPPPTTPVVFDLLPDFAFEGCRGVSVRSPQPIDRIQALLPEGFTAAPYASVAAPAPAPDGIGFAGMDLFVCGNLTTPNVRIPDVSFGMLYTHILPPDSRVAGVPEAAVHEYAFRLLAGEDVLAALWPAAGYDTYNGSVDLTMGPAVDLPVDVAPRTGSGAVGDDYLVLATSAAPAAPMASESTFARYTALADGSVLVWTGTYHAEARSGQGSFMVADDDAFAGFEVANNIAGSGGLLESAEALDQDLRRYF
ncbi:MAG TPA: hypothetical protein VM327_10290 [Candidatus Thermoplasmatota archaeon]|nr:hypothetical protein [Candidatus Thermoplasmatota archaeon]